MKEHIRIVDFSPAVAALQASVIADIRSVLPRASVEAIGSMAVPMPGKEEIDILIVSDDPKRAATAFGSTGFRLGPTEKGVRYLKSDREGFEIDAQIVPPGHNAIAYHGRMLAKLRSDEGLRDRYAELKRSLEGLDPAAYKEKKSAWIRDNLLD